MLPHLPLRLQASGLFARRRILSSFLCPPLLLLATAALSLLCRSILSIISGGHPYLTFIAAATATVWFRSLVIRHAPDATKRDDALGKCEVVLPLLSLAAAALVLRTVIGPAFRAVWRGDEGWRPATNPAAELVPSPAVMAVCIRLAVGMATLSLAVASRYLGWFSIMRCSSIPLRPNPFEATITMLRDHLSSPDAILDALLSPSPSKSSTVNEKKPMPTVQNRIFAPVAGTPIAGPQLSRAAAGAGRPPALGGRFLRPALPLWLAQILVHAASGCLFSFSFASSILPAGAGPEARGALHITCAFSSFLTVLLSVLWDGSHEIKYRSHFSARTSYAVLDVVTSLAVRTSANLQRANLIPYLVLVPVLCHTALFVTDPGIERDGYWSADIHPNHLSRTGGRFFAAVVSLVASIAIATYQVLVDTMIRRSLTAPGLDVDRLLYPLPCHGRVEGRAGGTDLGTGLVPFLPDDLIVQSIVWGCDGGGGAACGQLVRDLIAPRLGRASAHGPVYGGVSAFNMEEEEVRRSDAAIDAVAGAMLPSFVAATHGVGMLEEDTLRLALLESLGGTAPEEEINGAPAEARSLGLSSRHYHALRNRLQASEAAAAQRTQRIPQPMVVPLVRALCAYAGGLGEALVRISIQDSTFVETAAVGTSSSKRGVQYILPAGATACAKFSLLAAARLVALNAQARRHGWLSLLVPSVLHSAHRLRSGVLRYGESLMQRGTLWNGKGFAGLDANTHDKKIGKFIAIECPDLSRLLADCDEAATIIVRSLMHQDGARDTEIKVHSGCRKWLNGLQ